MHACMGFLGGEGMFCSLQTHSQLVSYNLGSVCPVHVVDNFIFRIIQFTDT